MKQFITIFLLTSLLVGIEFSFAQNLTVGIKGSFASTWLFNKYVSDAPAGRQDYFPSFGNSYGLSAAIFFNKSIGVEMNFFYAKHSQQYEGTDTAKIEYKSETSYNKIDVPVLLKFLSKNGAYFEIGPQYSIIANPTFSKEWVKDTLAGSLKNEIDSSFAKSAISGLIGFGVNIKLVGGLYLTTALRFDVSISDLKGVDALGKYIKDYPKSYPTRSAAAGFLMGLTYRIGKKGTAD